MYENTNFNSFITLALNNQTKRRLSLDTQLFDVKSPTTLINIILRNYYDTFKSSSFTFMRVKDVIRHHLKEITDDKATEIVKDIVKGFDASFYKQGKLEKQSFRFDQKSLMVVEDIRKSQLYQGSHTDNSYSIGIFMRNLLTTYAQLSIIEREQIVFKDQFEVIQSAIKSKRVLHIYYKDEFITIHPYLLVEAVQDYGQYLVCFCEETKSNKLLLLRKIKRLRATGRKYELSETKKESIKTIEINGPKIFDEKQIDAIKIMFNPIILDAFVRIVSKIDISKYNVIPDEYINDILKILSNRIDMNQP